MTEIYLSNTALITPLMVQRSIDIAKQVAQWVRTANAQHMDVTTVIDQFEDLAKHVAKNRLRRKEKDCLGLCFRMPLEKSVIWIQTRARPRYDIVDTLAHELAHAFSPTSCAHGRAWRAMYARLLPLVRIICHEEGAGRADLQATLKIRSNTWNYSKRGATYRNGVRTAMGTRVEAEADEMIAKSLRCVNHFADIAGLYASQTARPVRHRPGLIVPTARATPVIVREVI